MGGWVTCHRGETTAGVHCLHSSNDVGVVPHPLHDSINEGIRRTVPDTARQEVVGEESVWLDAGVPWVIFREIRGNRFCNKLNVITSASRSICQIQKMTYE